MPSTTANKTQVNIKQCLQEAKIIGYLLGIKITKKDPEFVPQDLSRYHTLPLRSLNRVATHAAKILLKK